MCFDDFVGMQDYDGQPIPLHEHQDGFEFFNRLVDQVPTENTTRLFFFAPSDLYTENDHVTKTGSEQQTWEEKHSQKDPFSGPDG